MMNLKRRGVCSGMASYVTITREELEAWLEGLPWKWSRKTNTAGIYLVHLSEVVAVKVYAEFPATLYARTR